MTKEYEEPQLNLNERESDIVAKAWFNVRMYQIKAKEKIPQLLIKEGKGIQKVDIDKIRIALDRQGIVITDDGHSPDHDGAYFFRPVPKSTLTQEQRQKNLEEIKKKLDELRNK